MTNEMDDMQEKAKQMVDQGRQSTAGLIAGGDMIVDADPERGFFRVKLRNVQPKEAILQLTMGFCWVLANGAAMFNLQYKQHVRKVEE